MNQSTDPQQPPVSFSALPTEIRHLIYFHLFSSVTIVIGSTDQLNARGVLSDDFWGPIPCSFAPAFHISAFEGFEKHEDRYDKVLKDRKPFSQRHARDAQNVVNEGRKHGWRDYDRGRDCPGRWQPMIETRSFLEDDGIPTIGARMELIVLDAAFRIEDLPVSLRENWLPQIRYVTFAGNDSEVQRGRENFDARYKYDFDLREIPALKTLHIRDRNEPHLKKLYVEYDEDLLRSYAFGAKDRQWIEYWFEQQATLSRLEYTFKDQQKDLLLKDMIAEKIDKRYWLRHLMLDARKRNFQIVKRLRVTLELIRLPTDIPREYRPVMESQLRGRTIVYIDFDFDIDTREVLTRLVCDHKDRTLEGQGWVHFDRDGDVPWGTSSDVDWVIPDPRFEEDDSDIDESDPSDED